MTATETIPRVRPMPETPEPGTKTVRIDAELAKSLQTIAALSDQMGLRFKAVEFLNSLLRGPVEDLFDKTTKDFAKFQAERAKRKGGAKS